MLESTGNAVTTSERSLNLESSDQASKAQSDEYAKLQLRIFRVFLIVSACSVVFTYFVFGIGTSTSLLVGALSGIVYLRLLARSIGKLGKSSNSVSKVQLVVPVLLVLAVSRLPEFELIPALLGFLLYKPSLILQVLLES